MIGVVIRSTTRKRFSTPACRPCPRRRRILFSTRSRSRSSSCSMPHRPLGRRCGPAQGADRFPGRALRRGRPRAWRIPGAGLRRALDRLHRRRYDRASQLAERAAGRRGRRHLRPGLPSRIRRAILPGFASLSQSYSAQARHIHGANWGSRRGLPCRGWVSSTHGGRRPGADCLRPGQSPRRALGGNAAGRDERAPANDGRGRIRLLPGPTAGAMPRRCGRPASRRLGTGGSCAALSRFLARRNRGVEAAAVRGDHLGIEVGAVLRCALLGGEVDVHDAEALRVALRPLEVVEQRPDEVAAHVDARPRARVRPPRCARADSATRSGSSTRAVFGARRIVERGAVLGDVERADCRSAPSPSTGLR